MKISFFKFEKNLSKRPKEFFESFEIEPHFRIKQRE